MNDSGTPPTPSLAPETAAILASGMEAVRNSLASMQATLEVVSVQAEQSGEDAERALEEGRVMRLELAGFSKELKLACDLQQQLYRVVLLGEPGSPSLKELVHALRQQQEQTAAKYREGKREQRDEERSRREFRRNLLVNLTVAIVSAGLGVLGSWLVK